MKRLRIAIYGKALSEEHLPYLKQLIDLIHQHEGEIMVHLSLKKLLKGKIDPATEIQYFSSHTDLLGKVEYLFSLGGDGTLLDTITFVRNLGIPIIGINLGRMGFLASIPKENIGHVVESLVNGNYKIDSRTLLRLDHAEESFGELNFALNELSIHKKTNSSMITIHVWVNDLFLNAYWADGLLISTPTGSTAYSLSCNGPIVGPDLQSFVISPIASHNLTVRPIVIPDTSIIRIRVEGRDKQYFVGLDSRTLLFDSSDELVVQKESFNINLLHENDDNFFSTIRKKLLWGRDIRN
ncbi:MAG: NAD kinase [Bacteroidota bacterium]|nr:NAD kinase [Bacteroidota bacterium]